MGHLPSSFVTGTISSSGAGAGCAEVPSNQAVAMIRPTTTPSIAHLAIFVGDFQKSDDSMPSTAPRYLSMENTSENSNANSGFTIGMPAHSESVGLYYLWQ